MKLGPRSATETCAVTPLLFSSVSLVTVTGSIYGENIDLSVGAFTVT